MTRILLAVNDSPAGLAAARTAIRLAAETRGLVRAIHVTGQFAVDHRNGGPQPADSDRRSRAVLAHVEELAAAAGVEFEAATLIGVPARVILEEAASWSADVIILGRSGVRHVGQPFVGSQVLHVIEFADVPVVVVPAL
jgi:nucleotide-binding universal stress UspA family protein